MNRPSYSCHLCDLHFQNALDVINIFSPEGRQLKIAAKILFVLSIMISEDDPTPKFICRACFGQIEVNVRFTYQSRITHYNHMRRSLTLPHNHEYQEEVKVLMKMPIHTLFYRHFSTLEDLQGMYDTLVQFLRTSTAIDHTVETRIRIYDRILHRNQNRFSGTNGVLNASTSTPFNILSVKPAIGTNGVLNASTSTPFNILSVNPAIGTNGVLNASTSTPFNILSVNPAIGTNGVLNASTSTPFNILSVKPAICNKTKKTTSDSLMKGRQSNATITKPNITKNIKSSHMSLDQNKPKERTEDVICVDDDESNDDIVEVQPVQKNVFKPLNNFNNTIKINRPVIPTTNVLNISNALNFQRKIVPITDGSSKYSRTEEMTVTPDMPIPDIDIPNPVEAVYFNDYDPTPVVKPTVRTPLVTPETGFHFLFASEQTVDLTQSDNQQKKKRGPTKGKRKNKSHENQIMPPKKICKQSLIVPTSPDITSIMTQASTSKTPQKEQKTRKESIIVPVISEKTIESMQPSTSKTLTTKELKTRKKSIIVPVISEKTIESMQPSTSKTQLKTTKELKTRKKSIIVPVISEKTIKSMQPSTSKTQLKTTKELPVKTMPKPRPKRASAVASANSDSKNHLARKLGKHLHGEWKLEVVKLDISLYTCPICKKLFYKPESRRKHEKKHILPTKFTKKSSVQTVSALENTISTEQEEFLGYFNLVKQISLNVTQMDRLATRKKLLKSLKCVGDVIGSYSCHHCEYKTCRLFILWAHMSSCHIQLYSEKKCGAFCFVCNRYLGKRSKLLKHLDNCTVNRDEDETKTTEKLSCDYCDEDIISMAHLEKHLWNHAAS